ncbi:hypothetical protein RRG08_020620 [Elysia crispata]|uniref:Uncharacterized protein n=1 Tax=Elysia crispata TaxID=231223 RepID=A0AAE0YPD5_9GAST|nr:hypothetical protein RRG08_020620 [Elysia crispata]
MSTPASQQTLNPRRQTRGGNWREIKETRAPLVSGSDRKITAARAVSVCRLKTGLHESHDLVWPAISHVRKT